MKLAISEILKAITLEVNMITRQITPFLSSTGWVLSFGLHHFKTFKIQFNGIPLYIKFDSVKYTFKIQRKHFKDC